MNKQILKIKEYIEDNGNIVYRNHGTTKEVISFSAELYPEEFNRYREKEFNEYYRMIKNQIDIVKKEYYRNIYSRRLLFQFNRFYYEDKKDDFLICPESFMVFFTSRNNYILTINIRSSDINRLEEDISIIKTISERIFKGKRVSIIKLHCYNIHCYLNEKYRIVIFEGSDCSGKTTLKNKLEKETNYRHLCIDRMFITSLVYNKVMNRNKILEGKILHDLIKFIDNFNPLFVFMNTDIDIICKRIFARGDDMLTNRKIVIKIVREFNRIFDLLRRLGYEKNIIEIKEAHSIRNNLESIIIALNR